MGHWKHHKGVAAENINVDPTGPVNQAHSDYLQCQKPVPSPVNPKPSPVKPVPSPVKPKPSPVKPEPSPVKPATRSTTKTDDAKKQQPVAKQQPEEPRMTLRGLPIRSLKRPGSVGAGQRSPAQSNPKRQARKIIVTDKDEDKQME